MTPKRRFEAAMRHQKPEGMVAFMELEFHIYEDYVGKSLTSGYEFQKLSEGEKQKALCRNAEIMVETAEKAGHDAIRDINAYWEISGEPAAIWLPDLESRLEQIKALKRAGGDKYFIIGTVGAQMGIPDGNSMYEFVADLYENPDKIKAQNQTYTDYAIETQKRMLEAGADGIINGVDIAFNNGPFISPKHLDEVFFPYFIQWVESLKSQGIISIWHTDGNLTPILDRVAESGVTAIQCVDPLGGMDIVEIKKRVQGKLALIGNIECSLLQFGPAEKIEAEVKRVVEGCKGDGGFALSACNAVFRGIPAAHYTAMVEARRKYGKE